jgi:hypothetical protein
VQIVSAFLQRATTPSGRSRNRARISIHVRVTNRGKTTIAKAIPVLLAKQQVRPDPATRDTTGTLLKSISPGETAGGRLRFETGGAVTQDLVETLRARLRIGGRTVTVELKLGRPPR